MSTAFKQTIDNGRSLVATAPSPASSGTSLIVTAADGAKFPAPGNGFWCTIWNATTYPDPTNDTLREIVLVTARSTDTFTITRAQLGTSARTVTTADTIALLDVSQLFQDAYTAINTLENVVVPKALVDCVVAPSGGDYTTVTAAYTAGKRSMGIVGAVVETGAINAVATVTLMGLGRGLSSITVPDDNTKVAVFSANNSVFKDISFIGGTVNLASNADGWVNFGGTGQVVKNCSFSATGSAVTTTGSLVACGKLAVRTCTKMLFADNYFTNNNAGQALITFSQGGGQSQGCTFARNTVNATQKMRFFYFDEGTADVTNLHILDNVGIASSDHASGNFIDVDNSVNANGTFLVGLQIKGNVIRTDSPGTGKGINANGAGASSSAEVSGNSVANGSTSGYRDITVRQFGAGASVVGAVITNNHAGTLSFFQNIGATVTGNLITTSLTNGGNTQTTATVVGNVGQNGSGSPTISLTGSNFTKSVVSDNVFTSDITVAGTNNTMIGNRTLGNITFSGSGHVTLGNRCDGTYADTSTTSRVPGPLGFPVGGVIVNSTTTGTNVTTTETDLFTSTIAASVLGTNGDVLQFFCAGTFAATANNKQVKLKFGATTVLDTGSLAIVAATNWSLTGQIIRTGATTQKCYAEFSTSSATLAAYVGYSTAAETLSGTVILKTTGTGTANADISGEIWKVLYIPAA